jgi:hypothetical protein
MAQAFAALSSSPSARTPYDEATAWPHRGKTLQSDIAA